ncbi:hypothetical protein SDC9_127735 [bioreactor metagenome]|uniref:Uncharacterized protein n=1 Tax=bioreactor metagenome TaxID=1076179 RepID=A0A645CUX8_9ZZZZ
MHKGFVLHLVAGQVIGGLAHHCGGCLAHGADVFDLIGVLGHHGVEDDLILQEAQYLDFRNQLLQAGENGVKTAHLVMTVYGYLA